MNSHSFPLIFIFFCDAMININNSPPQHLFMSHAYLKFATWAQTSGVQYPDWYLDLPGYRADQYVY